MELRNRLFLVAGVFIIGSGLAYWAYPTIFDILTAPLEGQKLSYLTVGGGLTFTFMVMIGCGLIVAMPLLLVSLYSFVSPALPSKAQARAPFILISSIILTAAGALFGYYSAIPGAIDFLTEFAGENLTSMLTTDSYLSFILAYTIGLGLLFQLPLVLLMINWVKPLGPKKLLSFERYVVVGSFVAAAIITPTPDPFNQAMIAVPVIAMYQIGFFAVMWVNWREKRRARRQAAPVRVRRVAPQPAVQPEAPVVAAEATRAVRAPSTAMGVSRQPTLQSPAARPVRSLDGFSVASRSPRPDVTTLHGRTVRPSLSVQAPPRQPQRLTFSVDGVSRMRPSQL